MDSSHKKSLLPTISGFLTKLWLERGIHTETLLMMLKASLVPTIVIAIHQTTTVANITTITGYLAALFAVSAQCLMPRAQFIKTNFLNLISGCVAASFCCLAVYTAVLARQTSSQPQLLAGSISEYNSSACIVSALWLAIAIWIVNAGRAWRPDLQDVFVTFSLFSLVTLTQSGRFTEVSEGLEFIARLLKTFLLGVSLASCVSLLVLPRTCRRLAFKDVVLYATSVENTITILEELVQTSLEDVPVGIGLKGKPGMAGNRPALSLSATKAARDKLNVAIDALHSLDVRIQTHLEGAKSEVAWGKLDYMDLKELSLLLRNLLLPLSALSLLPDLLNAFTKGSPSRSITPSPQSLPGSPRPNEVALFLDSYLAGLRSCIMVGMRYVQHQLELDVADADQHRDPIEEQGVIFETLNADSPDFISLFQQSFENLLTLRRQDLDIAFQWSRPTFLANTNLQSIPTNLEQSYCLILHLLHLQDMVGQATLALSSFAKKKVSDGTMKNYRLIYPRDRQLPTVSGLANAIRQMDPTNIWKCRSDIMNKVFGVLGSSASMFGLRVTAAAFSIGIIAFLPQTQDFFIRKRGAWAMIVIVIGMSPTSGQSLFGFVARILATVVSVVLSLIVWYAVDGKTPGIICFLFLANVIEYWGYVSRPHLFGPCVIAIVTLNIIVGYEVQVQKIGVEMAETTGQPYYPIYIFGPYKLTAVAIGCAVSLFWVIFPSPITDKSKVPLLMGKALYNLSGSYADLHRILALRLGTGEQPPDERFRLCYPLNTRLVASYDEMVHLLETVRKHARFAQYEPSMDGKFPFHTYSCILSSIQRISDAIHLIANVNTSLPPLLLSDSHSMHIGSSSSAYTHMAARITNPTWNSITACLCHLSAALCSKLPLPPIPTTFDLELREDYLRKINCELLHLEEAHHPSLERAASLLLLRAAMLQELGILIGQVRVLVGDMVSDTSV